jgi:hypothetical protein
MIKTLVPLAFCVIAAATAHASIVDLSTAEMSAGTYIEQQSLAFDGTTLDWSLGLPPQTGGFFVQAFDDFGDIYLSFGEWNGAPYLVTSSSISFNASVQTANPLNGQNQFFGSPISNEYFGIRYDGGGGNLYYGWINLSTNSGGALINGVAFNTTPNADILAGQTAVPEPKEVAIIMTLAAIAAILYRRRSVALRRAQTAAG